MLVLRPYEVAQMSIIAPGSEGYMMCHKVKHGITGWAQIKCIKSSEIPN